MTLTEQMLKRSCKADTVFLQNRNLNDVSCLEKVQQQDAYKVFHLNNNVIASMPDLAKFAGLTMINLSCNHIRSLGFLGGLQNVRHLFLDHNDISDRQEFAHIRNRRYTDLTVFANPFIDDQFDAQRFQREFGLDVLCFNGVYARKEEIVLQKQYKAVKGREQQ